MIKHKGFVSVIMNPGRIWSDWGVVDLEKAAVVATCSNELEADRICDALGEVELKKLTAPKALLTQGGAK